MFEFHCDVDCPYCGESQSVIACFNNFFEPVQTTEDCSDCYKAYTVSPWVPEIEAYSEKKKQVRKLKT